MNQSKNKTLAYSYVRMSSDAQLKGNSLERQKEKSKEYALRNNLHLIENFEDIGVSAFKGKNLRDGMLGEFLVLIENKTIPVGSYLLIESLDRLSRENIYESIPLFIKILKSGIKIVTLIDEKVYGADNADFQDLLYPLVVLSRAHEESLAKSYRVSKAWENKRKRISERKLTQICPAWLRLNTKTNSFEIANNRDQIVKRMFELADSGYGSYSIARILNDENVPPFSENSKGWHASYISRIINNRAVLGEFQPHKIVEGISKPTGNVVLDYFPQIINEAQFLRVQYARRQRLVEGAGRKGRAYRNLFSGIAKCAYCGSPMRFINKGPLPNGGNFIRCTEATRHFKCTASSWNYEKFETAFLYFVQEIDLFETLKKADEQSENYALEKELISIQEKILTTTELREATFNLLKTSNTAIEFVKEKLEEISSELLSLEDKKVQVENSIAKNSTLPPIDEQQIKSLISGLKDSDNIDLERKRRVIANRLKMIIKSLTVAPDGLRRDAETKVLSQFGRFDALFDFFEPTTETQETKMSFSVVFLDGVMRRVTVDRNAPLSKAHYLATDRNGLIIDMNYDLYK